MLNKKIRAVGAATLAAGFAVAGLASAPAAQAADTTTTITFQVDRYMPRTDAQARVVNNLDNDDVLKYREDNALWGRSAWQFVSVKMPTTFYNNASEQDYYNYVAKAINAKTNSKVGDIYTTIGKGTSYIGTGGTDPSVSRMAGVKKGQAVTIAWQLGDGAAPTTTRAWGAKHNIDQVLFGHSSVKKF